MSFLFPASLSREIDHKTKAKKVPMGDQGCPDGSIKNAFQQPRDGKAQHGERDVAKRDLTTVHDKPNIDPVSINMYVSVYIYTHIFFMYTYIYIHIYTYVICCVYML